MKNQLFALIGLGLLLATASAYAQTGVVKAKVPFNFIVNKTQISAGQYLIHPLGTMNSGAMTLESSDRKVVMAFLPNACESSQPPQTTKVVFHRYGEQYFLAQIWSAGNERGHELPKTEQEREVAMSYPAAQDVVVVATLR
jgi:hypothetical protein